MGFLAPIYLALGVAAAVPLLVHLWHHRSGIRTDFPAVRYLKRAKQEHRRQLRVRNLLLMLLRVAAMVLLALAAARPLSRMLGSWLTGTPAPVAVIKHGGPPPPHPAVTEVMVRPIYWAPRGEIVATVTGAADSVPYRITLNGHTMARGMAANGPAAIIVHAAPADRGWLAGTVELDPDALHGGDVRHFTVSVADPPVITVDSSAGPFVGSAVAALVASGEAAVVGAGRGTARSLGGSRTRPSSPTANSPSLQYSRTRPSFPPEMLGSGPGHMTITSADHVTALPAVITAPLNPGRIGAANRALERLDIPWRYGALQRGDAQITFRDTSTFGHAANTVQRWYPLVPSAWAAGVVETDTIAWQSASGAPWTVQGPGYVLLGSPLLPQASTVPLRAGFVPWIEQLVTQGRPAVVNGEPRKSNLARHRPEQAHDASERTLVGSLLIVVLSLLLVEAVILRRGTSSSSRRDRTPAGVHASPEHPSRAA